MASPPNSQAESPPSLLDSAIALDSLLPPVISPPTPNKSSPPPSPETPPPPTSSSPPPTTSSPPPVTPSSPPPPSSPSTTPPSPHAASPPPSVSVDPPPQSSSSSQSPPPVTFNTFFPPTFYVSPPPRNSHTPSSPLFSDSPPVSSDSSSSPSLESPSPSTSSFSSPPVINSSSSPDLQSSTTSPLEVSPNTSTVNGSSPKTPLKSDNPSSNAKVHSTPRPSNASENNDHAVRIGAAIGIVVAAVIVGFMLAVLFVQRRRKKHSQYKTVYTLPSPYNSSQASGSSFIKTNATGGGDFMSSPIDAGGLGNSKSWFSYEELTTATNGFASQNILGAGGFGCVYKGSLPDGREVAVKKLKDNSGQGEREFQAEVEIISRVHHRYLVALVGYCISDHQRLLVYEFVPNGTLHHHLHSSSKPPMEWPLRVKVACGSARGIAYLHEDCHPRIIHRDIKSPNILVDNNFEAKVADFGLAKLAQELESNTHISTRVMGTFGYMAPEYASSGKLTEKSDVFSFGVVLLEIITGRKPVDETRPLGDESLVEWARPLMTEALEHGNFDELADPRLQGNYDKGEMFRLIEAAAACVRHSALKRPKMSQVVRSLDALGEQSDLSNGMKPGQSGIYDSREQSAQIRLFQRMAFGSQEVSSDNFPNTQGSWPSGGTGGQVGGWSGHV